jgi:copper chaperone
MITFEVNDMTCGHCASTISKAVAGVDKHANVQIDLRGQRVVVEPTDATMQQLSDAIKNAGYNPVAIDNALPVPAATKRGGCCCG